MSILKTERLILRDFVLSDWDALNAFLSDPSVTRFMHFAAFDERKRREWLTSLVQDASNPHRDAYNWAITLRSNGLLIGWLILGRNRHATAEGMRECGCGYALNQHYWGQSSHGLRNPWANEGFQGQTSQDRLAFAGPSLAPCAN